MPRRAAGRRLRPSKALPPSMTRLGMIYHNALGVERDPAEAAQWWQRAAARGDADGQAMLGAACIFGAGVARDPLAALAWLAACARRRQRARRAVLQCRPRRALASRNRRGRAARRQLPCGACAMIIGTAGHIDHGKTSLVRALTGVDTDRLKEEKARGISIDLGFAYLPAPDGAVLGFVDVPGHEKFVHNMLAGATGIDFVLLVVAADDGVMPQTRRASGDRRSARHRARLDGVDQGRLGVSVAAHRGG